MNNASEHRVASRFFGTNTLIINTLRDIRRINPTCGIKTSIIPEEESGQALKPPISIGG
jgi:hypothetical protein